jgi:WD40 repeat protein
MMRLCPIKYGVKYSGAVQKNLYVVFGDVVKLDSATGATLVTLPAVTGDQYTLRMSAAGDKVYSFGDDGVYIYSIAGGTWTAVPSTSPLSIIQNATIAPNGDAYVSDYTYDKVLRIDASTGLVTNSATLTSPGAIVANASNVFVNTSNAGKGIYKRGMNLSAVTSAAFAQDGRALVLDATYAYATTQYGADLRRYDLSTMAVTTLACDSSGINGSSLFISEVNGNIYLAQGNGGASAALKVVNAGTFTVSQTATLGANAVDILGESADGSKVYVALNNNTIVVVDVATGSITNTHSTTYHYKATQPLEIAFTTDNGVSKIDRSTHAMTVLRSDMTPSYLYGLCYDT